MRRVTLVFAAMLVTAPALAGDVTGTWMNDAADTKVRVTKCGEGVCGAVTWLREPNDATGKPKVDKHNPEDAKRGRRLIGVPVLLGMKPSGADRWSGRIYNADDGKTYVSHMELSGADTMKVQGCVLGGLLCKTMTWTRSN